MPDVETIRNVARSELGATGRLLTGECRMLARLLADDEPIRAIVIAVVHDGPPWARGRVVVATPQRILLVSKALITRRERVRDIALSRIRDARATPPGALELELDDELLRLSFAMPARQLAVLADAARGGRDPDRFARLGELAHRKLGRFAATSYEGALLALAEALEPDEAVLDLAFWTAAPGGLVAVCDARLVAIPEKGLSTDAPISLPYDEIVGIRAEGADLVARGAGGEHRFAELGPPDRAGIIAARIAARVRRARP